MTGPTGTLYLADLLVQDEHWITGDGRTLRLNDMDPAHLRFALAFCRRYAATLHYDVETALLFEPESDVEGEWFWRDALLRQHQGTAPEVWIDDTPLVRRLVALVPREPRAPRWRRFLPRRLR